MDEIEDRYLDKTKQYNDPLRMWVEELDRINTDLSTVLINAVEDFGRAQKRIDELESDLKLNTSILAKQTDLAREAESSLAYYKERACCDPSNKWGHTDHCKLSDLAELKEAVKKHKLGRREDARFRGISMEGIDYHAYK